MSGWKLYVHGNTVHHSHILHNLLGQTIKRYDLTAKIANKDIIRRNSSKTIAWSSMVIYLNELVFKDNTLPHLISEITNRLSHYAINNDVINGARQINSKISYRYDIVTPIQPMKGISYEEYRLLYRGEYGLYNIKNNIDVVKNILQL